MIPSYFHEGACVQERALAWEPDSHSLPLGLSFPGCELMAVGYPMAEVPSGSESLTVPNFLHKSPPDLGQLRVPTLTPHYIS